MSYLLDDLVRCEARSKLLRLLLVEKQAGGVSELARRTGLSPRAIGVEVDGLLAMGLVHVETHGATRWVMANGEHPAIAPLEALLTMPSTRATACVCQLRSTLAYFGAPLVGEQPQKCLGLESAIVGALAEARHDATLLRVLPVVIAKNRKDIDWRRLKADARSACLKAELGWLIEATGLALDDAALTQRADDLRDRRRTRMTFYPDARSRYERQLAQETSPDVALRWGFWMNMSDAGIQSMIDKHCPESRLA